MKPSKSVLAFVQAALNESQVYKSFLTASGVKIAKERVSAETFTRLPISSKENYIHRVDQKLLLEGKMIPEILYASSGSSGSPTFWYRDERTIIEGEKIHRYVFERVFGIPENETTLVIVTFSMGLWVAGLFTSDAIRALRSSGYRLTVATPGIDKEEGLRILQDKGSLFSNVVIVGYPPFVLDFLREAKKQNKRMHPSLYILTAGDSFSETWRDEALVTMGQAGTLTRVVSIYGSADAGPMAFETALSIRIRRKALMDSALRSQLYGSGAIGGLYQFLPSHVYFEEIGGELLVTKRMPLPLIRYNIHDRGHLVPLSALRRMTLIRAGGIQTNSPLLSVTGRTDVAVTFYALNIYPEHITAGLPTRLCTGSFFATTAARAGAHSQRLTVDIELKAGVRSSIKNKRTVVTGLLRSLLTNNMEYKKLSGTIGAHAVPTIRLYAKGRMPQPDVLGRGRGLLQIAGKKPRVTESPRRNSSRKL